MKTPDEIKTGLNDQIPVHFHIGDPKPRLTPLALRDLEVLHTNAIAHIHQLEAKNNVLYHTLIGVMHFVDKWLDDAGYDPESDADGSVAINRAAKAREIALKAIEEAENRPPF